MQQKLTLCTVFSDWVEDTRGDDVECPASLMMSFDGEFNSMPFGRKPMMGLEEGCEADGRLAREQG